MGSKRRMRNPGAPNLFWIQWCSISVSNRLVTSAYGFPGKPTGKEYPKHASRTALAIMRRLGHEHPSLMATLVHCLNTSLVFA